MKPAPFKYIKASCLEEALDLLAQYGDDARVLAGGQSLMPTLALRLSEPALLIDINGLSEIDQMQTPSGQTLILPALTRHASLVKPQISRPLPLLGMVAPWIAHPGIRNRGTLGGSLSVGDPASELPACAVALDATLVLASKQRGERRIKANDFYHGVFSNAREPEELITACEFPVHSRKRVFFREICRRKGDYATAACIAVASADSLSDLRLVFFGVADRPILATAVATAIASANSLSEARSDALKELERDLEFRGDLWHSAAVKSHLCKTLLSEVVHELRSKG